MIVADNKVESYLNKIRSKVDECYSLAKRVRELGRDVTDFVEIPLATDMADRIEELIDIEGIADEIRELSKTKTREEMSLDISRKVAKMYEKEGKKMALDKAVRVGLAILTEGILVAPLEGIADVSIEANDDGTDYASIMYSGPIRGAGGTAQAMSVLIADIVRRDLGIGVFKATEEEIERYIEEVQSYNRLKHLQYLPSPDEIRSVIRNSPVCLDGEGSEEEEVSGHRDMKRVKTNRIRGGMCLVLCEGLIQKSKKILKHTSALDLHEWDFLGSHGNKKEESGKKVEKKSEKFLKDLVAGRPVFSHPGKPGGFRLRYGRSRVSGLAAASLSPATMYVLGKFIAIGAQLKVELPGKAVAVTPCDTIEGPTVLLSDGTHERIDKIERAKEIEGKIERITDVGEILISYGDFLENNYNLVPSSFTVEWWNHYARSIEDLERFVREPPDQFEAVNISRSYGVPLHPKYDYFWHDIEYSELLVIEEALMGSRIGSGTLELTRSPDIMRILIELGIQFKSENGKILISEYYPFIVSAGFDVSGEEIVQLRKPRDLGNIMKVINELAGIDIIERAPTRVGARMGRPEKAGDRKMKPKVHVLFPIENYGDSRRSIINASNSQKENYSIEIAVRTCKDCGQDSPQPICPNCGSTTTPTDRTEKIKIDLRELVRRAEERTNIKLSELKELKGVKKLMSKRKVNEPIEKGFFRSKHEVSINKDGTCRFDMSDIPITHFRAEEIGLPRERLESLGYEDHEINEIYAQDLIIPRDAARYLLNVSRYIDDLLVKYYGLESFYGCKTESDLIGHLVIGLAPHTSGGIVGRIIGFSEVNGGYAHPFFHAAKRRNCDGDEDSIMLLLDGLINFSKEYLPSTRGGLMDAPLVLTVRLNPDEVDKEAMNVDTLYEYPLEFYEATQRKESPSTVEEIMKTMKVKLKEEGRYRNAGFSFDTANINDGVLISSYKTIGSMEEKIENQLSLAKIIRAVDEDDVAARVLSSHFLPDIFGNFRSFFSQEFRCTKCNAKYRRVPLSGKCLRCKNDSLTLTIHRGGIVKYLKETVKVSENFKIPFHLKVRIDNLVDMITGTFVMNEDKNESKPDPGLERFGEMF